MQTTQQQGKLNVTFFSLHKISFHLTGNLLGGSSPSSGGGSSTRQRSSARAAAAAAATTATTTATPAAATTASAAIPLVAASTTPASGATSVAAASAPSAAAATKAPIQLSDLQSILSGIKVPSGASAPSGPEVDLSQGLTSDLLQPLLENEEFVRKMKDLLPTVPGDDAVVDAASEIKGTVQSPQV